MAELKKHRDNVWLIETQTDEFDVRAVLLIGAKYALVWDTLSHPNDMREVNQLLGDLPFYVVYSHADWDHIWGNAGFERPPLAIIAHELTAARFKTDVPEKLRTKRLEEPKQWDAVVLMPPNISFDNHLTLDLGGISLELHPLRGHTEDCIIGFCPELGLWLGGDTIETPLPVIEVREEVESWASALEGWSNDKRVRDVIPSHGNIGKRHEIRKSYDYLATLLQGKAPTVPDNMPEFYRTTHQENLKLMGI